MEAAAVSEKNEKKKRVIHTRVPEYLERELKEQAAGLGVSVSNLVRNLLLNAFGLVEDIVQDSAKVAGSARRVGDPSTEPLDADAPVIGWQELTLNLNAICEACNNILSKGTQAAIAVTDLPGKRPVLCLDCLEELRHDPNDP
jgi:hypothetical protein